MMMRSPPLGRRSAPAPSLYLFTPLPPQRNGLADYIVEYLEPLARDFTLTLVAENGVAAKAAALYRDQPFDVINEAQFLARQPDALACMLYNLGNNADCVYMLDYVHRFPGLIILHDVSLFYLHQLATQNGRAHAMMGTWLVDDGQKLPEYCLHPDGSLARTPGLLYQECLMVRRLAESARGLVIHSDYAERRIRGGAHGVSFGPEHGRPIHRIPHFVLPPAKRSAPTEDADTLARFGLAPDDFVLMCPGFLSGNKMLYEILVAYRQLADQIPGLKLVYAGEERPEEYSLSDRIKQLWPAGDGPVVTGYLTSDELDILLERADVSFVLRYPTFGETSGILPRAVMGGGRVITVSIGSYPEFQSPAIEHVPAGARTAQALHDCVLKAWKQKDVTTPRGIRRTAEARRARSLTPRALYPRLRSALLQSAS